MSIPSERISFERTLNDSGMAGSIRWSPSTMFLYILVRPRHIVGFHGQHFLQGVCGAVGFERPDLHFPEPLPAELRLTAQRLLRDETVGTGGPGMHLVIKPDD